MKKLYYLLCVPYVFFIDFLYYLADESDKDILVFSAFFFVIVLPLGVGFLINKKFLKAAEKTAIISFLAGIFFWIDGVVWLNTSGKPLFPLFYHDEGMMAIVEMVSFILIPVVHMLIFFIAKSVDNYKNSKQKDTKRKFYILSNVILFLPYAFLLIFLNENVNMFWALYSIIPLILLFGTELLICRNFKKALFWSIINNLCSFFFILGGCLFLSNDYFFSHFVVLFINLAILQIIFVCIPQVTADGCCISKSVTQTDNI